METSDFSQFRDWYSARQQRRTGRPASTKTTDTRVAHVRAVSRLFGCVDHVDTGTLLQSREGVEQVVERLSARMTSGAVRSYLYSLLSYGEWAKSAGIIQFVALDKRDIPSPNPRSKITVYSRQEIETLITAARGRDLRWWAFVTTMADTGRRVGEVLGMEWDLFRLHHEPAYIELPMTKNGRPNLVPLTNRLTGEVFTDKHIQLLMTEQRNGRRQFNRSPEVYPFPWTYSSVMKRFRHFCETVGLPYRGWHNLRHSLITRRLANGVPLQAVSALAGHSSVSVTDRYYSHVTALSFVRYVEDDAPDRDS